VLNFTAHDFLVMTAHLFAGIGTTAHPFALGVLYQLLDRQQVLLQSISSTQSSYHHPATIWWIFLPHWYGQRKIVKLHIESFNERNRVCVYKQTKIEG
jgi:ABC-type uncharacterized transport system YnjBCD permease subunit